MMDSHDKVARVRFLPDIVYITNRFVAGSL